MDQIKKFLEFNGKAILFLQVDGTYFVAIKPICEALGINYNRQYQNLKKDQILSQLFAVQQMVGADNKMRDMICFPEKFIYGWLFSIQSSSSELLEYKLKCYEVLYDYFHGTITQRQKLLKEKTKAELEIDVLEEKLDYNEDYRRLKDLKANIKDAGRALRNMDKDIINAQLDLWQQDFVTEN